MSETRTEYEVTVPLDGIPFWRRGEISQADLICLRREAQMLRDALQKVVEIFEIWECEGSMSEAEFEVYQIARKALEEK